VNFFNINCFLLSIVLKNELFEEHKCAFVSDFLSDLRLCNPCMRRVGFLAIVALLVHDNVFYDEGLLQHRSILNFFLNCDLDFQPQRMGLSPKELRVH